MGRSFSSGGPKGAVNGKPTARLRAHNHAEGLTRRLRRGRRGFRPEGGSTFFRSERKYQRKHAARRLREKGFYCPFCRRGSQRRAQFSWTDNSYAYARSCARLFPPSKWAGLFPFAAYRRSAPPQLARGRLQWRCLRCFSAAGIVSQRGKTSLIFSSAVGAILTQPAAAWDNSVQLGYFCNAKGQRDFISTLAFSIQLT